MSHADDDSSDEFVLDNTTANNSGKKKRKAKAAAPSRTKKAAVEAAPPVAAAAVAAPANNDDDDEDDEERRQTNPSAADIQAIKAKNAHRSNESVSQYRVGRLSGDLMHVDIANVGPTAASLGIPYAKAQVGSSRYGPSYRGVVIHAADYADLKVALTFNRLKKQRARASAGDRAAAKKIKDQARASAALARQQAHEGFCTTPEFYDFVRVSGLLAEPFVVNALKISHAAASLAVASADAAAAAAAKAELTAAAADVRDRLHAVEAALHRAFDTPVPLPHALSTDAAVSLVDALVDIVPVAACAGKVAAALVASARCALSWRLLLAAHCTPCAQLSDAAPAILRALAPEQHCDHATAVAELRSVLLAEIAADNSSDDNDDDDDDDEVERQGFVYDEQSDIVCLLGGDTSAVGRARRLRQFDAKMAELHITVLSPTLKNKRAELLSEQASDADVREELQGMTLVQLRAEARRIGASLRGATRKDDIVDILAAAMSTGAGREERLNRELSEFLDSDAVRAEALAQADARVFLEARSCIELLELAVDEFHRVRYSTRTMVDSALAVLVSKYQNTLKAQVTDAVLLTWKGEEARWRAPSMAALLQERFSAPTAGVTPHAIVAQIVAQLLAERQAWLALEGARNERCRARKAELDRQLLEFGYGGQTWAVTVQGMEIDVRRESIGPPVSTLSVTIGDLPPYSDMIRAFVDDVTQLELVLPASLDNYQRKRIHDLLSSTCLTHQSRNFGHARQLVIGKPNSALAATGVSSDDRKWSYTNGRLVQIMDGTPFTVAAERPRLVAPVASAHSWAAHTLSSRSVSVRWPPRLNGEDVALLERIVTADAEPPRLPAALVWRAARRATLLDALKRIGAPWHTILATASAYSNAALWAWLSVPECPMPRATARALVGNVAAAQALGDIFAALPIELVRAIAARLHKNDRCSAAIASRVFGLGVAVQEILN